MFTLRLSCQSTTLQFMNVLSLRSNLDPAKPMIFWTSSSFDPSVFRHKVVLWMTK